MLKKIFILCDAKNHKLGVFKLYRPCIKPLVDSVAFSLLLC